MTNSRYTIALAILFGVLSFLSACANTDEEAQTDLRSAADADPSSQDGETLSPDVPNEIIGPGDDLPEELQVAAREWTGDLDGMVERGYIRALVVYNRTGYFLDGPQQKGITYEALKEFEKFVNQKLKLRRIKLELYFLPVRRDELLRALTEGSGDLAAANLTITPERQQLVDFSIPAAENVKELVVTGPNGPALSSVDDLSGQEVHVRKSSSYFASLRRLNDSFKKAGKDLVQLHLADENLEDEDLLEMVNAGLIPAVIVDDHKAKFWAGVLDGIKVHDDVAVNTGGRIGWAVRKNSPELLKVINEFVKGHRAGTLFGNIMLQRYLKDNKWVKNVTSKREIERLNSMVELFEQYAGQYDFDWLLIAAQAYQESGLDQSKRNPSGAIGVMQMLPSTAAGDVVNIPDIEKLERNIHAGTKYLRYIVDKYYASEDMD